MASIGTFIIYVFLMTAVIHPSLGTRLTARACEGRVLHIECPNRILIDWAHYDRRNENTCRGAFVWWSSDYDLCYETTGIAKQAVEVRCHGKQSCSVAAIDAVFGDPCPDTKKYLEVRYRCL
ncbi:D-galactoside-specific lectin-like [Lytechinus variegatus]|uniref:D-galactoside-specific lectin-like n=1 Tax=Lytechinus variegatus TaxID=7654 RepID=UPI001BB264DB|nr:D-galactoside-specific lectin-like [Lytechinus variegatus]